MPSDLDLIAIRRSQTTERELAMQRSRGTGPRATVSRTSRFIVGRGPVPRHARSREKPARMRGAEGLRATGHAPIAGDRPPRYGSRNGPFCRSRSPDLDPIAIRRSQTTDGGTRVCPSPVLAGDRPPRYGSLSGPFYRRARACPSPCCDREGQAHALRARKKKKRGG